MKTIFNIIFRLMGLPFFMIIAFIGVIRLWIVWIINYIRFGGEAVSYTENERRKTILDVFNKVQERQEQEELLDGYNCSDFVQSIGKETEYITGSQYKDKYRKQEIPVIEYNELIKLAAKYDKK